MNKIETMTRIDLNKLDTILTFKKVGKEEIKQMEEFICKFIDDTISICYQCSTQIRFAHKRIVNWAEHNLNKINEIRYGK